MEAGIQVSSFKPILKTAEEVRHAFFKMHEMGCEVVQIQWIDPSVEIDVIAQAMAENHIRSVSVQDFYELIRADKAYYIELNRRTGGTWMCVSRIPERLKSREGLAQFVEELREFARELEAVGQKICFHPVKGDYQPIDGVRPVEYLMREMPELDICLDLYHLYRSGYDMPKWIREHAARICMVHFKDAKTLQDGTEQLVPAGQGETNWDGVVKACIDAGVPYGFAEQERWERDPFISLQEAFDWIRAQK